MTAASPGFPGRRHGWGQIQFKPLHSPRHSPRLREAKFSLPPSPAFRGPRPPLSGQERAAPVGSYPRGLLETPRGVVCFSPVWRRGCGGEGCGAPFPSSASGASIVALPREAPHPLVRRDGCKVTCTYSSFHPPSPPNFSVPRPLSVRPTPFQPLLVPAKSSCLSHCPVSPPNQLCSSLAPWRFCRGCPRPGVREARAHPLAPPPPMIRCPGSVPSNRQSRPRAALQPCPLRGE